MHKHKKQIHRGIWQEDAVKISSLVQCASRVMSIRARGVQCKCAVSWLAGMKMHCPRKQMHRKSIRVSRSCCGSAVKTEYLLEYRMHFYNDLIAYMMITETHPITFRLNTLYKQQPACRSIAD